MTTISNMILDKMKLLKIEISQATQSLNEQITSKEKSKYTAKIINCEKKIDFYQNILKGYKNEG